MNPDIYPDYSHQHTCSCKTTPCTSRN